MKDKTEIKSLTLKVAGQEITLTIEQAKELQYILNEAFASMFPINRIYIDSPVRFYQPVPLPYYPSWQGDVICQTLSLTATT